jgi:hypothetical protein
MKMAETLRTIEGSNKKQNCYHCNKNGHFVRDCPDLGGSGKSKIGAKFGTAKGFRETDDPSQRPFHYRKAVTQRIQQRANMLQKKLNGRSKNRHTFAQQRKRGTVENPEQTQYNLTESVDLNADSSTMESLAAIENLFTSDVLNAYEAVGKTVVNTESDDNTASENEDDE